MPSFTIVANGLAMCALVAATMMSPSIAASVLRYVALAYLCGNVLFLAVRGYYRRRPHWTAQSWRSYLVTCAIPVGALAMVACLLVALDQQLVGAPGSIIRVLFAVITTALLVAGAGGVAVVIMLMHAGEPSKPFIGPRALLRPFSGTNP